MTTSNKMLLLKTIVWRCIATLITFFVSWGVSGNLEFGVAIGGIDATIKFISYFLHEKAWDDYLSSRPSGNNEYLREKNKRKDDENTRR